MQNITSGRLRRPNGRAAACDPCRARKVACDHGQPVCKRCQKRKQGDKCVYSSNITEASVTTSSAKTPRPLLPANPLPTSPNHTPSLRQVQQARDRRVAPDRGYLGFTSYCTVLEETVQSLSLINGSTPEYEYSPSMCPKTGQHAISFKDLPPPLQEMAIYVLSCLPGQSNAHMVFRNTPRESHGPFYLSEDRIIESLQDMLARLSGEKERDRLEAIAELLCTNTVHPLREVHTSAPEYIKQFTGRNLRWESLGLLWTHLERISDILDGLRGRRVVWADDKPQHDAARTCLSYCIELSLRFSQETDTNDLLVDICRRRTALDSVVEGDGTLNSSCSHGATISMITYMGLHALQNTDSYQPSMCSENKRRMFAQVYTSDKLLVSFTGRPPLISRRYCSTPLLLDLPDEILAMDQQYIIEASKSLDSNGWNTDGGLYSATLIRARYLCAVVRDEIIEIALGHSNDVTPEHILAIRERQIKTVEGFPAAIRYHAEDVSDQTVSTEVIYGRLMIQLEHLQNVFFVERLLLRFPGYEDTSDLLVTSFDLLVTTLLLWMHKDIFSASSRHFEWVVISYAVPAGGILCQELLQPTFFGAHPRDPRLTRSSIVQKLSLLVGFLDWVRPSAPNGDLCADSKTIIQRVLDEHLNRSDNTPGNVDGGAGMGLFGGEMDIDGFPTHLDFNFDLLDTFDWLRSDTI